MSQFIFDHVGILVRNLDVGCEHLRAMLGALRWTERFVDQGLGVTVVFARDASGLVYELIAPLGNTSPVAATLASKVNLLNQIAYRTPSLKEATAIMRRGRAMPVGIARPAVAFGGAYVQFFISPLGFLVELIEGERCVHEFV